jgi:Ca-activated chloride channel homolog
MRSSHNGRYCIAALLTLGISFSLPAQMPSIKTEGKESNLVYLQKLSVDVSISGTVATTTWTMTFKNKTSRLLEGELNFPLPQGISVSRYALDINGRLREAVPVEKEKATLVFENTERRKIDPGILEKVDGNGFRTRIYPINGNGTRTVLIGYEEELSRNGQSAVLYRLPLAFQYPLEDFTVNIKVIGNNARPVFEANTAEALQFDEWKNTWAATRHWKDYQADQSIAIRIPKTPGAGEAMMQHSGNHYFYLVSAFPQQKKIEKQLPRHITLLWDASLSGLSRNLKKELSLLDGYLSKLQQADITLVNFSNTVQEPQKFVVHSGQCPALRTALQNTVYDGATQFGALDLRKYPCDEFLLFSDGRSNFGSNNIQLGSQPLYAIASAAGSDFSFLQYMANSSGGECINLEKTSIDQAKEQLLYQTLQFLGVRRGADLEESYPSIPTAVINGITVTGISYRPVQDLVLQFGYSGKVVTEQTIRLDFSRQQVNLPDPSGSSAHPSGSSAHSYDPRQQASPPNLSRIWAQKKIAQLDTRYDDNKPQIEQLGKRYGIVTRNTSLIVLENVSDYITYQIEPPADLREAFDHIMKGREQNDRQTRQLVVSNAETYFDELLNWWQADHTQAARPKTLEKITTRESRDAVTYDAASVPATVIGGRAAGISSAPLQEVVVVGYGTARKKDLRYNENPSVGTFTALKADIRTDYLDKLKAAPSTVQYALYLQLRKEHSQIPLFYFNTAGLFLAAGKKALGLRILSNIAELDVENYELYKLLGYKLKELGETEAACSVFKKILDWRPFEPQSYRDYGLALQDAGHYQQALDTLYLAMVKNYDANVSALYPGIEETILPEINNLAALQKDKVDVSNIPKNILSNMPVDIRVVLNWNMNNTDIDLWVTDPDNEKCYYSHRNTGIGGRIAHDFTRGLGPEQFLLKKAVKGTYKVEVNYYGDTQVKLAGATTIMVEVYTGYGTPSQTRRIITLQMLPESKGAVYVGEFDFK